MSEHLRTCGASLAFAWCTVFLSTIASGVLAVMSLLLTMQLRGSVLFMPSNTSAFRLFLVSVVLGVTVGAPVGALSGLVLAPVLRNRSRRIVAWAIAGPSMIAGPVAAPFFHIFAAGIVFVVQGVTTIVIGFRCRDLSLPVDGVQRCMTCGYSLAGLDRAKTTVCPECGESLPVKRKAV